MESLTARTRNGADSLSSIGAAALTPDEIAATFSSKSAAEVVAHWRRSDSGFTPENAALLIRSWNRSAGFTLSQIAEVTELRLNAMKASAAQAAAPLDALAAHGPYDAHMREFWAQILLGHHSDSTPEFLAAAAKSFATVLERAPFPQAARWIDHAFQHFKPEHLRPAVKALLPHLEYSSAESLISKSIGKVTHISQPLQQLDDISETKNVPASAYTEPLRIILGARSFRTDPLLVASVLKHIPPGPLAPELVAAWESDKAFGPGSSVGAPSLAASMQKQGRISAGLRELSSGLLAIQDGGPALLAARLQVARNPGGDGESQELLFEASLNLPLTPESKIVWRHHFEAASLYTGANLARSAVQFLIAHGKADPGFAVEMFEAVCHRLANDGANAQLIAESATPIKGLLRAHKELGPALFNRAIEGAIDPLVTHDSKLGQVLSLVECNEALLGPQVPRILRRLTEVRTIEGDLAEQVESLLRKYPHTTELHPVYRALYGGDFPDLLHNVDQFGPKAIRTLIAGELLNPKTLNYDRVLREIAREGWHPSYAAGWDQTFGTGTSAFAQRFIEWLSVRTHLLQDGGLYETSLLRRRSNLEPESKLSHLLVLRSQHRTQPLSPSEVARVFEEIPWRPSFAPIWETHFRNAIPGDTSDIVREIAAYFHRPEPSPDAKAAAFRAAFTVASEDRDMVHLLALQPRLPAYVPAWIDLLKSSEQSIVDEALRSIGPIDGLSPSRVAEALESSSASHSAIAQYLISRPRAAGDEALWRLIDKPRQDEEAEHQKTVHESAKGLALEVPHEPGPLERVTLVLQSLSRTESGLAGLRRLEREGLLAPVITQMLLHPDERLHDATLNATIRAVLAQKPQGDIVHPHGIKLWPTNIMRAPSLHVGPVLGASRMAIIGDGPAAIFTARLREELGYNDTVIVSPKGQLNGIWNQRNVVDEGHNTFRSVEAFGAKLSVQPPRHGVEFTAFLDKVSEGIPEDRIFHGSVTGISFDKRSNKYRLTLQQEGRTTTQEFDSVAIATGNSMPKPLDHGPMQTNAHTIPNLRMARWQQQIPAEDYVKFENTSTVIVGLGNSAIAMIGEFMKMERAGIKVNPVILTHYSKRALENPTKIVLNDEGGAEGPMYRTRANLNRIAGDIAEVDNRFQHALKSGWIVPGVRRWDVELQGSAPAEGVSIRISGVNGLSRVVERAGKLWVLIGYQGRPDVLTSYGCRVDPDTGRSVIDPMTGRVSTTLGDNGRMYAIGAVASRAEDRNQEVVPGIMRMVPQMLFADLIAAQVR